MTDTATVETLTAEVRVLMVGNRQITRSIARQLDQIPLRDLTPFGRVRLDDHDHTVIGSDPNGTLAVAHYIPGLKQDDTVYPGFPTGEITACRCLSYTELGGAYRFTDPEGLRFDLVLPSYKVRESTCWDYPRVTLHEIGSELCAPKLSEMAKAAISHFEPLFVRGAPDDETPLHVKADAMPLIVLAGLR